MIKDFKSEVLPSGIIAEKSYFGFNTITIINNDIDSFGEHHHYEIVITADDAARIYGIFNPVKRLSEKCVPENMHIDPEETTDYVDHVDVALFI